MSLRAKAIKGATRLFLSEFSTEEREVIIALTEDNPAALEALLVRCFEDNPNKPVFMLGALALDNNSNTFELVLEASKQGPISAELIERFLEDEATFASENEHE